MEFAIAIGMYAATDVCLAQEPGQGRFCLLENNQPPAPEIAIILQQGQSPEVAIIMQEAQGPDE